MQTNDEWREQYVALIGLDWADQEHAYYQVEESTKQAKEAVLAQTPEAIEEWARELNVTLGGRTVALCLEQSRGALLGALMKYPQIHLYPLDGKKLRRFRESYITSGDRDDPKEAKLLWEYLSTRGHQMRAWKPDTEETRLLGLLNEERRHAVNSRTDASNEALATLKGYFPLAIQLLGGQLTSPLALAFFKKWLTLEELKNARPATIEKFFHEHGCHNDELNQARIEKIKKAVPLVTDRAIIEAGVLRMARLLGQVRELNEGIKRVEQRIKELFDDHPDAELFKSLPGAGDALAPRLLAAHGTDRERWQSAGEIQCLQGIAPVRDKSGKKSDVKFRWSCAKFHRQTWVEFANQSIKQCAWARAFYDKRKDEGLEHQAALRELAFKWSRIVFRCWKNRTPYNEAKYLESLIKRNSPLLKYMRDQM